MGSHAPGAGAPGFGSWAEPPSAAPVGVGAAPEGGRR
jgi:hypothetical protein